jgi:hypothetical protein
MRTYKHQTLLSSALNKKPARAVSSTPWLLGIKFINGKIIGNEWNKLVNIGKSTINEGFYIIVTSPTIQGINGKIIELQQIWITLITDQSRIMRPTVYLDTMGVSPNHPTHG